MAKDSHWADEHKDRLPLDNVRRLPNDVQSNLPSGVRRVHSTAARRAKSFQSMICIPSASIS